MQKRNMYVFIISSLNVPIYRKIQKKRRKLLQYYDIPYTVLINENESVDDNSPTLVPVLEDEIFYNGAGYNPFMAQKFLNAVKMYFRSFRSFDDVPNYIVRINATLYVHFPSLQEKLASPDFPKTRVLAGLNWLMFVQGMIMVFSKDVLLKMINDPAIFRKDIMQENDDISLSQISRPYADWYDLSEHMIAFESHQFDEKGLYKLKEIQPRENKKWIFRICHYEDRDVDIINWDRLLHYFNEDNLTIDPPKKSSSSPNFYILLIIFIIVILILLYLYRIRHDISK